jgi:uncharacterized membrane protein YgdD (TMEM256/DUF423 family)
MEALIKEQFVRLLRYAYPGFLAFFFYAYLDRKGFREFHEATGTVLVAAFGLTLGATIFVAYRFVLGELLIFPAVNALHTFLAKRSLLKGCVTGWLGDAFLVPLGLRRAAYGYLRSKSHEESEVRRIDLVHTELHLLYSSAITSLTVGLYTKDMPTVTASSQILAIGLILFLSAVIADIQVHIRERVYFETVVGENRVRELLTEGGYCKKVDAKA